MRIALFELFKLRRAVQPRRGTHEPELDDAVSRTREPLGSPDRLRFGRDRLSGLPEEQLARRGDRDASRLALEQREADFVLEARDRL